MAYSYQAQVSTGTLTRVLLAIEFFDTRDIHVFRSDRPSELVETVDYTWDGRVAINLKENVPKGVQVSLRRVTDRSRLRMVFSEGIPFERQNLDEQNTQFLYIGQEASEVLTAETFGDLNMHRYKVVNMEAGTAGRDAVNVSQLAAVEARVDAIENIKGSNRRGPLTVSNQPPTGLPQQFEEWVMIGNVLQQQVHESSKENH